jgi:nicotinate-nucleotide adenylyltransferase
MVLTVSSPPHKFSGPAYAGMRIGILGGSFNPAHDGHLAMSLYALKRLKLDQIWWLVSPQNPLKPIAGMASLDDRVQGAQRMATHPRIRVTALESELGTRYTIDTLHVLKRRFSRTQFVWLMGADNLEQMPRWRDWAAIFASLPIAVFRRQSYASGRLAGKAAQRFSRFWLPVSYAKALAASSPPVWLALDNRLNFTSATAIRGKQRGSQEKNR